MDSNNKKIIVITGGGTSEKIDDVRRITNSSTGRLSKDIAEAFLQSEDVGKVYLLLGKHAVRPDEGYFGSRLKIIDIEDTNDLLESLRILLSRNQADVIIHAMAVSDYTVKSVMSVNELVDTVNARKALPSTQSESKISSNLENPVILLKKTPKVISYLRAFAPDACIVGFKLLSHVENAELVDVARKLLIRNDLDFVLANDARDIAGDIHLGYLVAKEDVREIYQTKQMIAHGLVTRTLCS
ncbi:MAG: phosphopantothenate--cysteine ligase [Clostridiales Family XIII bacterium]|jgi:phosphopantothenate-cysteine ligase|nr:phosphopantothenate--cysteine ligase [Clostridiales Family XIII bacterium]